MPLGQAVMAYRGVQPLCAARMEWRSARCGRECAVSAHRAGESARGAQAVGDPQNAGVPGHALAVGDVVLLTKINPVFSQIPPPVP